MGKHKNKLAHAALHLLCTTVPWTLLCVYTKALCWQCTTLIADIWTVTPYICHHILLACSASEHLKTDWKEAQRKALALGRKRRSAPIKTFQTRGQNPEKHAHAKTIEHATITWYCNRIHVPEHLLYVICACARIYSYTCSSIPVLHVLSSYATGSHQHLYPNHLQFRNRSGRASTYLHILTVLSLANASVHACAYAICMDLVNWL